MKLLPLRSVYDKLSKGENERLTRLLEGIKTGSDKVLLTPLGENIPPEDILKGWDVIFGNNSGEMNEILLTLEENNRSKYGPRSIAKPWVDRRIGVLSSFEPAKKDAKTIDWIPYPVKRLRPLSVENALKYIKRQTSAGLPWLEKKGAIMDRLKFGRFTLSDLYREAIQWPSVMFTRTQEQEKTRTVWGYPLVLVIFEMCFYRPMLEFQRTLSWRAALRNPDDVDQAVTKLIVNAIDLGKSLVSIDFRNFDDSVKRPLQEWFYLVYCNSLFQGSSFDQWVGVLLSTFNIGPLVTPDGIFFGEHGIPSGSAFTNEAGSCVQHGIAQDYFEPIEDDQQQGDDGISIINPLD